MKIRQAPTTLERPEVKIEVEHQNKTDIIVVYIYNYYL